MKIKIFVDWKNETIHTEKSIEEEKKIILDDVITDEYEEILGEYLDNTYSLTEIFNLNENEKKHVREIIKQKCKDRMEEVVVDDFEEITLEV